MIRYVLPSSNELARPVITETSSIYGMTCAILNYQIFHHFRFGRGAKFRFLYCISWHIMVVYRWINPLFNSLFFHSLDPLPPNGRSHSGVALQVSNTCSLSLSTTTSSPSLPHVESLMTGFCLVKRNHYYRLFWLVLPNPYIYSQWMLITSQCTATLNNEQALHEKTWWGHRQPNDLKVPVLLVESLASPRQTRCGIKLDRLLWLS